MMKKRSRLDEAGACAAATPTGSSLSSSGHVPGIKALSASATSTLHTGSTSASSSSSSLTSMSQQPAAVVESGNDSDLLAAATDVDASVYPSLSDGPQQVEVPPPRGPKLPQKVGRWSLDEKILFLYGLKMYGKGRWKRMSKFLPDRSLVQIKSHGQKVLKRLSQGEDIFRRLEENVGRLQTLLKQLNLTFDPEVISSFDPALLELSPSNKRKREDSNNNNNNNDGGTGGREHILAASALCQLAIPGTSNSSSSSSDAANAVNSMQQQQTLQGATNPAEANALLLPAHFLGWTGVAATSSSSSTLATATSLQQQQQLAAAMLHQASLAPSPVSVQRQVLQQQQQQQQLALSADNGNATKQHSSWDGAGLPTQQQQQ